jgi:hypothetical protein
MGYKRPPPDVHREQLLECISTLIRAMCPCPLLIKYGTEQSLSIDLSNVPIGQEWMVAHYLTEWSAPNPSCSLTEQIEGIAGTGGFPNGP